MTQDFNNPDKQGLTYRSEMIANIAMMGNLNYCIGHIVYKNIPLSKCRH